MRYDQRRRLIVPDRLALPRRQRGSILLSAFALPGGIAWSLADLAASYEDSAGPTQTYGVDMVFRTDASVDVLRDIAADLNNEQDPYVDPTSQASNTWVRCHFISGTTMTSGDTLEVWHQLNVQRNFLLRYTSGGGADTVTGNFDFELSSDSSGSPIVAQALSVAITAGELF